MYLHYKTDFEKLLFEREHTRCLKKIIAVKNLQIETLIQELKLVNEDEFIDTVIIINEKDCKRVQRIKELDNRLKYFKKRYNQLLYNLKFITN